MWTKKMYQIFLALAGLILLVAQSVWAVGTISPQAAHDNAAAGNGVIIDIRTVEEHNGCQAIWEGFDCPNPDVENNGHPEWVDNATGVIIQPPNVPFWISEQISATQPEDPVEFAASFELLRNAGVISYDSPIYLISRDGFRSYWGGLFLKNQGYTNVYTVDSDGLGEYPYDGGMLEWYAAGLPQLSFYMPPQIYSVSPAGGEVLTSETVTFTVGIMEPTWGEPIPYDWGKSYVNRVSLYIDGLQAMEIILPAETPSDGLWTEFTFTQTLTGGSHTWNVEAVDEYDQLAFNLYSIALGPGDRILTICTDADSDGYSPDSGDCGLVDCNDSDASVYPGADDFICDGVDNNCDGTPDDEYVPTEITCGVGVCARTAETRCVDGFEWQLCESPSPILETEITCDDGLDNDCDGLTDYVDPDCNTVTSYTIAATASRGGKISPSGDVIVEAGSDQTFKIKPWKHGHFKIKDVLVDGVSVGPVETYTFENVTSDHTIHAEFVKSKKMKKHKKKKKHKKHKKHKESEED